MIKINFCDFWPGFETKNLFLNFMEQHFQVKIDDEPDYLFYSVYGSNHLKYDNSIKILFTGENLVPDFNLCDYAIGFHYLNFDDRYLRFPLYVYYQWYYNSLDLDNHELFAIKSENEKLTERKFCNFVYSNNKNADPFRDKFFRELTKYKQVDSGGKHLNNIGGPVKDKIGFIKNYKFTIAFENSSIPGYTTEKLIEPILANSIPIYYGNPLVNYDFDAGSFVHVVGENDIQRAIDEIVELDNNDERYLEVLGKNKYGPENNSLKWETKLREFLYNIFSQTHDRAHRRARYGFSQYYFEEVNLQAELLARMKRRNSIKSRVKAAFNQFIP